MISGRLAFLIGGSEAGGSTITARTRRVLGCGRNQLALPRHRPPGGEVVRLQAMALCDLIHHRAWPKALRNDLGLDLVGPLPVNFTSLGRQGQGSVAATLDTIADIK